MNEVSKIFEGREVRILDKDGELWFIAKDACDILGLEQVSRALDRLDQDQRGVSQSNPPPVTREYHRDGRRYRIRPLRACYP